MDALKVPYGLNDERELISAHDAVKGATYNCPSCDIKLIHRAGEKRVDHFAHPPSSSCNLESILHKTAKRLINNAITANAQVGETIEIRTACQNCHVEFYSDLPGQTFSGASEEVHVSDYVCDVAGYKADNIALAVEVFKTNKVNEGKAANLSVYWIELKAEDVINNPYCWNPTQSRLKPISCPECKIHIKHIHEIADKWQIDRSLYSAIKNPKLAPYIAETEHCFKCKEEIPVFWWQGVPFCEKEPPVPRPKTIKYRNSKQYGGAYWANTCANCNIIQGDNHLFIMGDAPLQGLPLSNEDSSNQTASVRVIAGKEGISEFKKVFTRNL